MIDICSHKGYLATSMNLVHMIKMMIQGQWLDQRPVLNVLQFEDVVIFQ